MPTYGEIRAHLNKILGGVDLDILDEFIAARYAEILDLLPWQRLDVQSVLQTVEEYSTGTVALTKGSKSVVGTGTVWTSAMSGRIIRIGTENSYYEFTYLSATTGELDRPYEGETASDLGYRINQNVYPLSADLRILHGIQSLTLNRPLTRVSLADLQEMDPGRNVYGNPMYYCLYMDQQSSPPIPQIELYPVPTAVESLPFQCVADADAFSGTSSTVAPWVRPAAIVAGVQADVMRTRGDFAAGQAFDARFAQLVQTMVRIEAAKRGPTPIKAADHLVRHQVWRTLR